MKRLPFLFFTAALLSAVSCEVQPLPAEQPENRTVTFTASYETPEKSTRTQRTEDGTVLWMPGNTISVQYLTGYYYKSKFTTGITQPSASATFSGTLPEYRQFEECVAIYPFYEYDFVDDYDETEDVFRLVITIPAEVTAVPGTFADGSFYSLARSKDTNLHFRHLTGGVKFSVTTAGITEVTLEAPPVDGLDNRLSGYARIDLYADRVELSPSQFSEPPRTVTLKCPEGETLIPGQWYHIVTLPTSLPEGFTLIFKTADKWGKRVISKPVTIQSGRFGVLANADASAEWKGYQGNLEDYGFEPID